MKNPNQNRIQKFSKKYITLLAIIILSFIINFTNTFAAPPAPGYGAVTAKFNKLATQIISFTAVLEVNGIAIPNTAIQVTFYDWKGRQDGQPINVMTDGTGTISVTLPQPGLAKILGGSAKIEDLAANLTWRKLKWTNLKGNQGENGTIKIDPLGRPGLSNQHWFISDTTNLISSYDIANGPRQLVVKQSGFDIKYIQVSSNLYNLVIASDSSYMRLSDSTYVSFPDSSVFGTMEINSGIDSGLVNFSAIGLSGYWKYDPVTNHTNAYMNNKVDFNAPQISMVSVRQLSLTALIRGLYNGFTMISDTAFVILYQDTPPYDRVDSCRVFLNSSGKDTARFSNSANGIPYYIAVRHRNAIETWSKTAVSFSGNQLSYDFTTSASKAYGDNEILFSGKYCFYSGDVNQDRITDAVDLVMTYNDARSFTFGYHPADIDGNQFVDIGDLIIVYNAAINNVGSVVP